MTFSDDPSSPAAPFSGDGSAFDLPDVVLQSPTTSERIVDTQSGFLVVVKRLGDRLGLSFKRHVGTPPSSVVMLSPDESIKLSRILSTTIMGVTEPDVLDDDLPLRRRGFSAFGNRGTRANSFPSTFSDKKALIPLAVAAVVVSVVALAGGYFWGQSQGASAQKPQAVDPLDPAKIDQFSRRFVADMLDFNPVTYRASQVQAMSHMSPDLLDKHWRETNFPLSTARLKALPQGATVIITRIGKERQDQESATADIYAELVQADSKVSSPIHLKLKLGLDGDGGIRVIEQEDLTAAVQH